MILGAATNDTTMEWGCRELRAAMAGRNADAGIVGDMEAKYGSLEAAMKACNDGGGGGFSSWIGKIVGLAQGLIPQQQVIQKETPAFVYFAAAGLGLAGLVLILKR